MGWKPRKKPEPVEAAEPVRSMKCLLISLDREEAQEIYGRLSKSWIGNGATREFVQELGKFLDSFPSPNQLELPIE